jgi:CheY-like chemotaxis protein
MQEPAGQFERGVVLVVEDDEGVRESVKEYLEESGFKVVVAYGGLAALEMLRRFPTPSVILLDLMMPDLDGWEFRNIQRSDPVLKDLPVIVFTAAGVKEELIKAQCGDVEMVRKPFPGDALLEAIQRCCH